MAKQSDGFSDTGTCRAWLIAIPGSIGFWFGIIHLVHIFS